MSAFPKSPKKTKQLLDNIAVVGGGIAGSIAALSLAKQNISCTLYEREARSHLTGAGIQLAPNATSVLAQLGMLDEVQQRATLPDRLFWLSAESGEQLKQFKLRTKQHGSTPYLQIFRPDLMAVMTSAIQNSPLIHVRPSGVIDVKEADDQWWIYTNNAEFKHSLVIAADGTYSKVRESHIIPKVTRKIRGVAFRALIPTDVLPYTLRNSQTCNWLNQKFHIVTYPVSQGKQLNCVFVFPTAVPESTDALDIPLKAQLKVKLSDACTEITNLINSIPDELVWTTEISELGPFIQTPTTRVIFIGDAWHTLPPYAAQGAAMAIEDGWELARSLHECKSQSSVNKLERFSQKRMKRVKYVAEISARNGWIYHLDSNSALTKSLHLIAPLGFRWTTRQLFKFNPNSSTT